MSTLRVIALAAATMLPALAVAAQTAAMPEQLQPMTGTEPAAAMPPVMDSGIFTHAALDQLEGRFNGANPEFRWDGQGWIGTDYDKLWIKSEGMFSNGALTDGQQQFLYDRAVTTYFDLQGGLRSDLDSRPVRNWAASGIQGLAPYFFDLELTGYVSSEGHLAAKARGFLRSSHHAAAHPAAANGAQSLQQGRPRPPDGPRVFRHRYGPQATV
jgi:copper resistance protein B